MPSLKRNERVVNLRPIARASAPLAVAACLTLVLAGCGSSAKTPNASKSSSTASPSASADVSACSLKSGSASNAVKVSGAYGATPTVTVSGTLKATDIERSITIQGNGAKSVTGDTINAHISLFNGTGKKIVDQDAQVPLGNTVRPVFRDALACVAYGSRTVVTAPASAVYDGASLPAGLKATDTLILVTDIKSKFTPPAPPAPPPASPCPPSLCDRTPYPEARAAAGGPRIPRQRQADPRNPR